MEFMSKIVLGGAGLASKSQRDLASFLGAASELGICEIDTAPSYGMSEVNIGRYLKKSDWKVNTKFGKPGGETVSTKEILQSVNDSLRNLKIEAINTLFIHSLPASQISMQMIEALNDLKTSGKILKIGYSGDGFELEELVEKYSFDAWQASLNVLDLSNYECMLRNPNSNWYIKRPLCNQIFKIKPKLELVEFIDRFNNGHSKDKNSYSFRYQALFGSRLFSQVKAKEMLTFLLSLKLNALIVVGTSNSNHLKELSAIAHNPELWGYENIEQHFASWWKLARIHNWIPLV
jgi:aryl-alcohol dehydrogenase-like predicted oxidoreductase